MIPLIKVLLNTLVFILCFAILCILISLADIFFQQMELTFFVGDTWFIPTLSIVGASVIMLSSAIESLRDFIEEKEI